MPKDNSIDLISPEINDIVLKDGELLYFLKTINKSPIGIKDMNSNVFSEQNLSLKVYTDSLTCEMSKNKLYCKIFVLIKSSESFVPLIIENIICLRLTHLVKALGVDLIENTELDSYTCKCVLTDDRLIKIFERVRCIRNVNKTGILKDYQSNKELNVDRYKNLGILLKDTERAIMTDVKGRIKRSKIKKKYSKNTEGSKFNPTKRRRSKMTSIKDSISLYEPVRKVRKIMPINERVVKIISIPKNHHRNVIKQKFIHAKMKYRRICTKKGIKTMFKKHGGSNYEDLTTAYNIRKLVFEININGNELKILLNVLSRKIILLYLLNDEDLMAPKRSFIQDITIISNGISPNFLSSLTNGKRNGDAEESADDDEEFIIEETKNHSKYPNSKAPEKLSDHLCKQNNQFVDSVIGSTDSTDILISSLTLKTERRRIKKIIKLINSFHTPLISCLICYGIISSFTIKHIGDVIKDGKKTTVYRNGPLYLLKQKLNYIFE